MSRRTIELTDSLYQYLTTVAVRDHELMQRLRAETEKMPNGVMQISPEQGQLMSLLVKLTGTQKALEIGTFTGYSALCTAAALPKDGRLTACDVSVEWTNIARRYWAEAGLDHKIDLRIGPAAETLAQLIAGGEANTYGFAFIDADKTGYDTYYEACLQLVYPGGLIAIDNVLQRGDVADPANPDENVRAIRALNQKIHADDRVDMCLIPIGDGLTLVRKR